jgi:uncharacterized LabA/DUF88 family protein
MKTAILIDGDFYLRRHSIHFGKGKTAKEVAEAISTHCMKHIKKGEDQLYRIFFYDCKPLSKKAHTPIGNRPVDLSKTDLYKFRTELHKELIRKPSVAIRYGYLDEKNAFWRVKDHSKYNDLIKGKIVLSDLSDDDFIYYTKQKGVDMKIGLDIATLTHKKLVDRIVLVSGDSDFVPAAKLSRIEGINFVLDPMNHTIRDDLQEHIDWLHTTLPPKKQK